MARQCALAPENHYIGTAGYADQRSNHVNCMIADATIVPSGDDLPHWDALRAAAVARAAAGDISGPAAALYGPLLAGAARGRHIVAHLGQSLDGRIAMPDGDSVYVTGRDDAVHNHRLRALCDAVIVGAKTVARDNPQLTVRHVAGDNPVRVIIDPQRRLAPRMRVFTDGEAATLLVCAAGVATGAAQHGGADIVAVSPGSDGSLAPAAIVEALAARGLTSLFIEGGGDTVARFIEAGLVDRLQITVAPIVMGDGHPVLTLPPIDRVDAARRVTMRPFMLGPDLLYDCEFDA